MAKNKINKYSVINFFSGLTAHSILILISVTCLFPLLWMVSSSLKTQQTVFKNMNIIPDVLNWSNYVNAWIQGGFATYFLNSVFYTVTVVSGLIY